MATARRIRPLGLNHGWGDDVDTGALNVLAADICRVIRITTDIEHGEGTPHASVRQVAELRRAIQGVSVALDEWVHDMEAAATRGS